MIPKQLQKDEFRFCLLKKRGKVPLEKNWTTQSHKFDEPQLQNWIEEEGNYGIIGGFGKLIIMDFDEETIQQKIIPLLPQTFTVTTGTGKLHKYFLCDEPRSLKILDDNKNTLIDIQGTGKQVVAPGSTHPNGNKYIVSDDSLIADITLKRLQIILADYIKEKDAYHTEHDSDSVVKDIKQKVSLLNLMRDKGYDTKRNPTMCMLGHDSQKRSCFSYNESGLWYCHHCDEGGDIFNFVMLHEKVDFIKAKEILMDKAGMSKLPTTNKTTQKNDGVELPNSSSRLVRDFAKDLAPHFKGNDIFFYKPCDNTIVEIREFEDKLNNRDVFGFCVLETNRLINLIEQSIRTYRISIDSNGTSHRTDKTVSKNVMEIVMCNDDFINTLHKVNRFFTSPIPFLTKDKRLLFPSKGYNKELEAYFTTECPEIKLMGVKKAKEIITDLLSEFCFKDKVDKTIAISYLLTPACRGIYQIMTTRTPLFLIKANRERAGKDYLAGVVGLIYTGRIVEDTPFATGDRHPPSAEELRKKITSMLMQGRRRIHSSNNKGYLNNAVLEQLLTNPGWVDRVLGKNIEVSYPNELDISLSANVGITYTPDLWARSRPINLFFSEEDPNKRSFKKPNLWRYVEKNRATILSAIFSLVKDWHKAGMPGGKTKFSSYPEWARIVGGIMQYHSLGDPCVAVEDDSVGGDYVTTNMKHLFEFINEEVGEVPIKCKRIKELILGKEEDIFSKWELETRSGSSKLGRVLRSFIGRELSGIIMRDISTAKKSSNAEFSFCHIGTGEHGELKEHLPLSSPFSMNNIERSAQVPKVTQVTQKKVSEADEKPMKIIEEVVK